MSAYDIAISTSIDDVATEETYIRPGAPAIDPITFLYPSYSSSNILNMANPGNVSLNYLPDVLS